MTNSTPDLVIGSIKQHMELVTKVLTDMVPKIEAVVEKVVAAALLRRTIFWCGNGGSAADSQHLAAELIGRFKRERRAIASLALTTDSSVLTSLANDYSYEDVFARQAEALVKPGDVLFAISTSGNSANVLAAVNMANSKEAVTIGLLGRDGGRLRSACRYSLVVPSADTARIQEMHIMIGHVVCDAVEAAVSATPR
jgi:D-sedoheptulose 7-phosphate isomerase